jgi:hypothetical protein
MNWVKRSWYKVYEGCFYPKLVIAPPLVIPTQEESLQTCHPLLSLRHPLVIPSSLSFRRRRNLCNANWQSNLYKLITPLLSLRPPLSFRPLCHSDEGGISAMLTGKAISINLSRPFCHSDEGGISAMLTGEAISVNLSRPFCHSDEGGISAMLTGKAISMS